MQRRNFNALKTPIIGRVLQLNSLLLEKSGLLNKRLQHTYADDILRKGNLLFNYAMRQLKQKDYYKRSVELTEEIQSNIYLVHHLGGYDKKTTAILDCMCDDIIEHLCKLNNVSGVRISKSTDDIERT